MLWIPGPTEVRPEIFEELTLPMIGHRSQAMVDLIARLDPGLRLAFGLGDDSTSEVAVGTHSATAMMEGSLIGAGQRILAIVNGAFSKRWASIAKTLGKDVHTLEVEWGSAVEAEELERVLESHGPFDACTVVLNETSTGVRTPNERLAPLRERSETLLLTDVVSGIAGFALDFDANGVDFALAGINKALALPPGLTVMCASERYLERARSMERRAWYLDPVRTIEGHRERKTPTTPCVALYRALARQLEDISSGKTLPATDQHLSGADAWSARFQKHERMRQTTLDWAQSKGLGPFPAAELSSPTVSTLRAESVDVPALIDGLKERGHEIGNGYGPLKNQTFRIGHMGDHTEEGLATLLAAADAVLG